MGYSNRSVVRVYLHFHFRVGVDVSNKTLIIGVLVIDLPLIIVSKVVPQGNQKHIGTEELGLLPVLISKHLRSRTKLGMVGGRGGRRRERRGEKGEREGGKRGEERGGEGEGRERGERRGEGRGRR